MDGSDALPENESERIAQWEDYYRQLSDNILLPNEYVTRIFLGNYPNLKLDKNYSGKKICDIGCGDGRNSVLLNKVGFQLYATEISDEICQITQNKLRTHPDNIGIDIQKGYNWQLPFSDNSFDYLLSWNACYYMESETSPFGQHISEFSRVLKPGGKLVVSLPMPNCCTLIGADDLGNNLIRLNTKSNYSYIDGSIIRRFKTWGDIEKTFGDKFKEFSKAELKDDCFGLALNYFVFVCENRDC